MTMAINVIMKIPKQKRLDRKQAAREDHREIRQFVREITLKLRSRKSKIEDESPKSVYDMIVE